jgi:hypothetical protein
MRTFPISLMFGVAGILAAGSVVHAEGAGSRTVAMPFKDCLAIMTEAAEDAETEAVHLVQSGDLRVVRINAEDGYVTISCSRTDGKMTLAKHTNGSIGPMASRQPTAGPVTK